MLSGWRKVIMIQFDLIHAYELIQFSLLLYAVNRQ